MFGSAAVLRRFRQLHPLVVSFAVNFVVFVNFVTVVTVGALQMFVA
jgi:hypothetical protein